MDNGDQMVLWCQLRDGERERLFHNQSVDFKDQEIVRLKQHLRAFQSLAQEVYESEARWGRKGVQPKSEWMEDYEAAMATLGGVIGNG